MHACAQVPKPGWQWDSQSHRLPPPAASPACAPALGQGLQAGRDAHPACQASSSDVSQELGTESRQVNPQPPPCLGITGSAVPGGGRHQGMGEKTQRKGNRDPQHVLPAAVPATPSHARTAVGGTPTALSPGSPGVLVPRPGPRHPLLHGPWGAETPCQGWGSELRPEERAGTSVPRTLAHAHHEAQPTAKPRRSFPTADPPPRYKPEPGWGSWGRAPRQT